MGNMRASAPAEGSSSSKKNAKGEEGIKKGAPASGSKDDRRASRTPQPAPKEHDKNKKKGEGKGSGKSNRFEI